MCRRCGTPLPLELRRAATAAATARALATPGAGRRRGPVAPAPDDAPGERHAPAPQRAARGRPTGLATRSSPSSALGPRGPHDGRGRARRAAAAACGVASWRSAASIRRRRVLSRSRRPPNVPTNLDVETCPSLRRRRRPIGPDEMPAPAAALLVSRRAVSRRARGTCTAGRRRHRRAAWARPASSSSRPQSLATRSSVVTRPPPAPKSQAVHPPARVDSVARDRRVSSRFEAGPEARAAPKILAPTGPGRDCPRASARSTASGRVDAAPRSKPSNRSAAATHRAARARSRTTRGSTGDTAVDDPTVVSVAGVGRTVTIAVSSAEPRLLRVRPVVGRRDAVVRHGAEPSRSAARSTRPPPAGRRSRAAPRPTSPTTRLVRLTRPDR